MSSQPDVSVIIPTYNRRNLLEITIQSVLAQTIKNFEIIIVDDGSTDGTRDFVRSIQDKRIIYLYRKNSGLPAVARNIGILKATGRFIAFLDSDDLWVPEKLERQVLCFKKMPGIGLCCTNGDRIDVNGILMRDVLIKSTWFDCSFNHLLIPPIIQLSSVLIRKEVVDKVGLFNEEPNLRGVEDYHYLLRIAHKFKLHYLNEILIYYRVHTNNIVGAHTYPLENIVYLMDDLQKSLELDENIIRRALRYHALACIYVLANAGYLNYKERLRALKNKFPSNIYLFTFHAFGPIGFLFMKILKIFFTLRFINNILKYFQRISH